MKKLLTLLLALGMLAALTGCRSSAERQAARRQLDLANGRTQFSDESYALDDGTTLEQTVVWDQNGVTVTVLGIYETEDSYYLPLRVENSAEEDIELYSEWAAVNGWTVSEYMSLSLVSGGADEPIMEIYKYTLDGLDITSVWQVEARLWCYSNEGDFESFSIPFTLPTSAQAPEEADTLPGQSVYTDSVISVSYLDQSSTSWSFDLYFAVENLTSGELSVSLLENAVLLNGDESRSVTCWGSYSNLPAGGKGVLSLELDRDEVEGMGLTLAELTSLSFDLECWGDTETIVTIDAALQ